MDDGGNLRSDNERPQQVPARRSACGQSLLLVGGNFQTETDRIKHGDMSEIRERTVSQ